MTKLLKHPKFAGESYPISVDFAPRLTDTLQGASLSSPSVAADTGLTVGSPSIVGTEVRFNLSGGSPGQEYTVTVSAMVTGGGPIQAKLLVQVS